MVFLVDQVTDQVTHRQLGSFISLTEELSPIHISSLEAHWFL